MADAATAKWAGLAGLAGLAAAGLAGCAPSAPPFDASLPLADGVWVGESSPDGEGAYGRSTVTVAEGEIAASQYVTVQADGSLKAEDYGKDSSGQIANRAAYRAAQKAVAAFDVYARQLIEVGTPADVDAISGATIAYGQFLQAATAALTQAQQAAG
ncbi:MAG: FMN-binding protein [Bifidobacteriaceae bacterium]|jgi:major membrane immunogen (membrane-anchored lipoprotein)|nr:FMN-binding protein [Bifidobacteriaceae bacterium]